LAGARESARVSTFERKAHRAREAFERRANYRAGLRCLNRSRDRSMQSGFAPHPREQFRMVLFNALETLG